MENNAYRPITKARMKMKIETGFWNGLAAFPVKTPVAAQVVAPVVVLEYAEGVTEETATLLDILFAKVVA